MIAFNALAIAGAAAAASSVVLLHPHQQVYFNGLEDRTSPWRLRDRYDSDYWGTAVRAGLERALAERPGADVRVCARPVRNIGKAKRMLRSGDRARILVVDPHDACEIAFSEPQHLVRQGHSGDRPIVPPVWSLAAYGSSFLDAFDMDEVRAARRRTDESVLARPPAIADEFDVWIVDRGLLYAKTGCAREDMTARFFLHLEAMDPADLPEERRRHGFDNRDFKALEAPPAYPRSSRRAAWERSDDRCLVRAPLPDYLIRRIRTGQIVGDGAGGWRRLWEGEIDIAGEYRRR